MVNLSKNNTKLNITKKINQLHQNPQTKIYAQIVTLRLHNITTETPHQRTLLFITHQQLKLIHKDKEDQLDSKPDQVRKKAKISKKKLILTHP